MDTTNSLINILCVECGRKLAKAKIQVGKLEIKCKCGVVNTIESKKIPKIVQNGKG